jgi:hypothetical protein
MGLGLERLLFLAAPFLAAVTARKKKRIGKPTTRKRKPRPSRPAKAKRARKATRRVARPASRKRIAPAPKRPARGRAKPAPAPQKPAAKTAPVKQVAEPLPKPVAPTGRPILLSPENGKYADSIYPKFRWLSVGGATRYEVFWGQDAALANGFTVVSIATEATVPVEKPLKIGVTYYWRVRGGNEAGWGPWSAANSFGVLEETE